MDVSEQTRAETWRCCSNSQVDRRCITYITQVTFGIIMIGFCIFKLSTTNECNETNLYVGLLGSTIGVFLPHPNYK